MKRLIFRKIEATGNDFIAIDNRKGEFSVNQREFWAKLCHRRKGIGADGVLLLGLPPQSSDLDFSMGYLNSDGSIGEMCGNGGRAIAYLASLLGIIPKGDEYRFKTLNSIYSAKVDSNFVTIGMSEFYDYDKIDLSELAVGKDSCYLNTGVPHAVFEIDDVDSFPLNTEGPRLAHLDLFEAGSNVNIYHELEKGTIASRTFERGVEDETLSCGTGATAMAIRYSKKYGINDNVQLITRGGELKVSFDKSYSKISLSGNVNLVFEGSAEI